MPKIVELREDRNLIQSNFEGYKLSLDPVPLFKEELDSPPCVMQRCENEQYSLLHVELFAMNNFLHSDPYARNITYFINGDYNIVRSFYDEAKARPEKPLTTVYTLSKPADRVKGDYNYSIRFISEKYCIVCDGISELFLFDTGDRLKVTDWKLVAKTSIVTDEKARNFTICDSRLDIIQEQKQISLALGRVQRVDNDNSCSHHEMHIHWAKWILEGSTWVFSILEMLVGRGSIYYCAFEPRSESLVIGSNRQFNFKSQLTALPSIQANSDNDIDDCSDAFRWSQTIDEITITFNMKPNTSKSDYTIKCMTNSIHVKCCDDILLDCTLFSKVDNDLTTWSMENDSLQVTLIKQIPLSWPSLMESGGPAETQGEEGSLPIQEPIANLEAPIEDCDLPMTAVEDDLKIERFHFPTRSITHTCFLSTPPLFTTTLRPGYPSAIATRQDVDAALFLQHYNQSKDEWTLRHQGNIHAFGYVQASKQDKKFMDCAPDLSYAIICESFRNIFLYRSNYDTANGLRNRRGPQVHIGKQQLITLEDVGEVLGMATSYNVVTLLTERFILYLKVNE